MCVPQSLDSICRKFDKFWALGQAHAYGEDGQVTMAVHNYKPR